MECRSVLILVLGARFPSEESMLENGLYPHRNLVYVIIHNFTTTCTSSNVNQDTQSVLRMGCYGEHHILRYVSIGIEKLANTVIFIPFSNGF